MLSAVLRNLGQRCQQGPVTQGAGETVGEDGSARQEGKNEQQGTVVGGGGSATRPHTPAGLLGTESHGLFLPSLLASEEPSVFSAAWSWGPRAFMGALCSHNKHQGPSFTFKTVFAPFTFTLTRLLAKGAFYQARVFTPRPGNTSGVCESKHTPRGTPSERSM